LHAAAWYASAAACASWSCSCRFYCLPAAAGVHAGVTGMGAAREGAACLRADGFLLLNLRPVRARAHL